MSEFNLTCQDVRRRAKIHDSEFNGLDYLEVCEDQKTLVLYFLGEVPKTIERENIRIEGGQRIRDIRLLKDPLVGKDRIIVYVDKWGDYSNYTLRLVDPETNKPMEGFDPRYAQLEFNFKVGCPNELDCKPRVVCPSKERDDPVINYLARDYASFRQLILDRLALILPEWKERHVPDLGIALVEILAYVGDHLSYYQDVVSTESYLETARQRISVRRHGRLVDYFMHEGCNSRAWVTIKLDTSHYELDPDQFYFITGKSLTLSKNAISSNDLEDIPKSQYEVFEPLEIGGPFFHLGDLKDPASFVSKLCEGQDEFYRFLFEMLSKKTKESLKKYDGKYPSESLQKALLDDLNRLLRDDYLYDEELLSQVPSEKEVIDMVKQKSHVDEELAFTNRKILESAFREEITTSGMIHLYKGNNEIRFYTWGDRECCLPRGCTKATLIDGKPKQFKQDVATHQELEQLSKSISDVEEAVEVGDVHERQLHLRPGDVLIFEEVICPTTGNRADADPARRHAVRLTRVKPDVDDLYDQPILEIEWAEEDALPFSFCISTFTNQDEFIENVSVARGNVILVDHGRTVEDEVLEGYTKAEKFHLILKKPALTFSMPLPLVESASELLKQDPHSALPQIWIDGVPPLPWDGEPLFPLEALINSAALGNLATKLRRSNDPKKPEDPGLDYLLRLLSPECLTAINEDEYMYLFNWSKIPGEDNMILIEFLNKNFDAEWVKDAKIEKFDGDKIIKISKKEDTISLKLNKEKKEVFLEIDDVETGKKLITRMENDESKIYYYNYLLNDLLNDLLERDLRHLLQRWNAKQDLLDSGKLDRHFVVEMDNERRTLIRFGDGELGMTPQEGSQFTATYRVGNGPAGNVGSESISHVVFRKMSVEGVTLEPRNPLAASGGMAPETIKEAKLFAPFAFQRELKRAVTAEDYAKLVTRKFEAKVQRASACLRWTGSWYQVLVAIDPRGGIEADLELLEEIEKFLYPYCRMGHELVVAPAQYAPLEIEIAVQVHPEYLQGHIKAELLDRFSNRLLPDGSRGFFHPDNLTFGEGVYLSRLVAAAQKVPGVVSATVEKLERYGDGPRGEIEEGVLRLGPMEVARLDNDPNFPENGILKFVMGGGR